MADNPEIQSEKLLKYGKKQLSDRGLESQATTVREVLDEIADIQTGVEPEGTFYVDTNGHYDIKNFADLEVKVPEKTYNSMNLIAEENRTYYPQDYGVDGFNMVEVNVPGSGSGNNLDAQPLMNAVDDYAALCNLKYSGIFSRVFEENSWDTISFVSNEISTNGYTAEQVYEKYGWSIGDTKTLYTLSGETCTARIIDFNHDKDKNGNYIGISFEFQHLLAATYAMNSSTSVTGGWETCTFRTDNLPTILDTMPANFTRNIKEVVKLSANGDSKVGTGIIQTTDKFFIPSAVELGLGSDTKMYNYAGEGTTYKFYADGGSRVKQKSTIAENFAWFTRTPSNGGTLLSSVKYYVSVGTSGSKGTTSPTTKAGICLMFGI